MSLPVCHQLAPHSPSEPAFGYQPSGLWEPIPQIRAGHFALNRCQPAARVEGATSGVPWGCGWGGFPWMEGGSPGPRTGILASTCPSKPGWSGTPRNTALEDQLDLEGHEDASPLSQGLAPVVTEGAQDAGMSWGELSQESQHHARGQPGGATRPSPHSPMAPSAPTAPMAPTAPWPPQPPQPW